MEQTSSSSSSTYENHDLKLRLALPGTDQETINNNNKRSSSDMENSSEISHQEDESPPPKAQVIGWPPVRSYRKNALQAKKSDNDNGGGCGMFVKVSMDGAPYLRKIDVKGYKSYIELLKALENMFKCSFGGYYCEREGYNGSELAPTYEDKDGDWMLVGDVPWDMFITSCRRLRIMKGSEAKGLGCL